MTAVSERPLRLPTPPAYRRSLSSGVAAIAVVASLLTMFALVATVALSPVMGAVWLFVTLGVSLGDGAFATPTRLAVDEERVTFGFFGRAQAYRGDQLVVTHDRSCDRLTITPRHTRRALARLRGDASAVDALAAAGAEIVTRRK